MDEEPGGLKRTSQATLIRTLEILLLLNHTFGKTVDELYQYFLETEGPKSAPSKRSIYRYILSLEAAGFVIDKNNGHFKVSKGNSKLDISNLLHFSKEESFILGKAINGIDSENEFKHKLAQKLYSLYDFDRVARSITKKEDTENILNLISAIKNNNPVILKNYRSANSKTIRDRKVEPIDFTYHYNSLWAFDTEDKKNKLFSTSRYSGVEIIDAGFKYGSLHKKGETDIFRIAGFKPEGIQLKLSLRAYNLLMEEYPLAEKFLEKLSDGEYLLTCKVFSFDGVGRFIMGLPGDVKIISPSKLQDFVEEKIKRLLNDRWHKLT